MKPMKPKILKVELSEEDQNEIFQILTDKFDLNNSDIWRKGQEINFPITEDIECWSKIDLYAEFTEPDEHNQTSKISQSVGRFYFDLFIDGESIEVKDWNIDDRIREFYHIQITKNE